jgi:hypothetical protein
MTKSQFEKYLNQINADIPIGDVRQEYGYLIDNKRVSEPTFRLYYRMKQTGTMLRRLDPDRFNLRRKIYC